jgi:hypothetical protein
MGHRNTAVTDHASIAVVRRSSNHLEQHLAEARRRSGQGSAKFTNRQVLVPGMPGASRLISARSEFVAWRGNNLSALLGEPNNAFFR